jgi:2-dehydropantoate 2-reductase
MKFTIVGAGALGSIYAAYLARAGHTVSLLARGERGAALQRHGITVVGQEAFSVKCNIVTDPRTLSDTDVVIVAVKTYNTDAAVTQLANINTQSVFSVQNGILKNAQLGQVFGSTATLGAVGMLGGSVLPPLDGRPGDVDYKMPGATIIGEPTGALSERVESIVQALAAAGLDTQSSTEIDSIEWSKFIGWSGISALAVLTRLPTYRFLLEEETATLALRVMRETASVARSQGIKLQDVGMTSPTILDGPQADAVAVLQTNAKRMQDSGTAFRQSILQDADRQRPLEVEETLGHTLTLAQSAGIDTPTLDFCCRILRVVSRAAAD